MEPAGYSPALALETGDASLIFRSAPSTTARPPRGTFGSLHRASLLSCLPCGRPSQSLFFNVSGILFLGLILTIFHAFLSSMSPYTRRATYSAGCTCAYQMLIDACNRYPMSCLIHVFRSVRGQPRAGHLPGFVCKHKHPTCRVHRNARARSVVDFCGAYHLAALLRIQAGRLGGLGVGGICGAGEGPVA